MNSTEGEFEILFFRKEVLDKYKEPEIKKSIVGTIKNEEGSLSAFMPAHNDGEPCVAILNEHFNLGKVDRKHWESYLIENDEKCTLYKGYFPLICFGSFITEPEKAWWQE